MTTNSSDQLNTTVAPADKYAELRQSLNTMFAVVLSLVSVLGVLGNGVVIWVTGFKMKKTVNTVWFLNLAVADFLFPAFLPLSVTSLVLDSHWPFGNIMCKLNRTLLFLNSFASVYILVVISVDRCVSVVWPVWAQNHRNVRKASFVSLGVWVIVLSFCTPSFFFMETKQMNDTKGKTVCLNNFFSSDYSNASSFIQLALAARFLLGFGVPFTVIVSCYAVIIHRLRKKRTLASQSSRTFKIITAIIVTFFLCWAPIHIMILIHLKKFTSAITSETLDHVMTIGILLALSMACLNSCLNPLLYVFMGQDFKNKVSKSILNALENVFQDEVPHSYTYTNAASQSNEKSVSEAQL